MDHIEEVWKTVPDYPDYDCSNLGRIRSRRNAKAKRDGVARILNTVPPSGDYPRVTLRSDQGLRPVDVHVLVAELFIGPRPKGLFVLHEDDDRTDARAHKLRYGTYVENSADAHKNGRQFRGSKHFSSKLTEEQVIAIRADPRSQRVIAKEYGVSKPSIANIKKGITYYDIPPTTTVHIKKRKVIPKLRKLRDDQIGPIKADPRPYSHIAEEYGVTHETIRCVKEEIHYKGIASDVASVLRKRRLFTDEQVRLIREDTRLHRVIAEEYGVSCSVITEIINRKTYKHVPS